MAELVAKIAVYRCGVMIDGTGVDASEDVAMVVVDDRIESIAPWQEDYARQLDPDQIFDLRGDSVVPGLIDAHAHLCLGVASSEVWQQAASNPVGIVSWGLASCITALRSGITTVVDVGSPQGLALRLTKLIAEGVAIGPTVVAAGRAITTTAGHGVEIGVVADDANEIVRAVRRCIADGAEVIKITVTGGATDPSSNRRRAQYTKDELSAAIADAHRLGRRVVGHANATEGISRAVAAGIDIIAHCNWLGDDPATITIDARTVECMAAANVWIDLNIQGALRKLQETDGVVLHWPYSDPEPMSRWELLQPIRRQSVTGQLLMLGRVARGGLR